MGSNSQKNLLQTGLTGKIEVICIISLAIIALSVIYFES
jgi:hypothetical protein